MGVLLDGGQFELQREKILSMDRKIGDYVIVHELLHFPSHHGKLWKVLMRAHLSNFEASWTTS